MGTRATISADILDNWPDNYHSDDLDSDKRDEFINLAQRWVCRRHNFTFMEQEIYCSTVDSQRRYGLPEAGDADWTDILAGTVRKFKSEIENGVELVNSESYRVPLTKFYRSTIKNTAIFQDTAAAGTPSHYCIELENIELWKLPDHSSNSDTAWILYLAFYGYLPDLSASVTSNAITVQYPEVLEYYATALGFRFGGDADQEQFWLGKAAVVLAEMIKEDVTRKLATIEDSIRPAGGQSLGGRSSKFSAGDLRAHYE